jgi:uncharacterized protein
LTFLLDVNVLIALIDPNHLAHEQAHDWFGTRGHVRWSTCPMTENGVIRIVGNPAYPNTPGSPATVAEVLRSMRTLPGHEFWTDDISLLTAPMVDPARLLASGQVTDTYLLALAASKGSKLATLDRKLSTIAVADGREALHLIGVD